MDDDHTLSKRHPILVEGDVGHFLERREYRRRKAPPLANVAWEKRPKWNGSIINLTPVVGGPGRAQ